MTVPDEMDLIHFWAVDPAWGVVTTTTRATRAF